MVEAEVTCECRSIQLPDLGLSLTQGMVVYLAAEQARKSADLTRAWRGKGVSVKYVQRYREQRPEAHPSVQEVLSTPVVRAPEVQPEPPSTLAPDAIAAQVVALLLPQIQTMIHQAVASAPREGVVLRGASVPGAEVPGRMVVPEDVPVFIPSKIGRDDLVPAFEVRVVEGEDSGVSNAAAALKAARKSEKRR